MALRDRLGRWVSATADEPVGAEPVDRWGALLDQLGALARGGAPPGPDPAMLKALRSEGYTEAGLEEIMGYAGARGIDDLLAAAQQYETDHPSPTLVANSGGRWDGLVNYRPAKAPDVGQLLDAEGNDERWLKSAITDTLRQMRSGDGLVPAKFNLAYPGHEFATR